MILFTSGLPGRVGVRVGGGTQNNTPAASEVPTSGCQPRDRATALLGSSPLADPMPSSPKALNGACDIGCNVWVGGWLAGVVTAWWFLPFGIRNVESECVEEEGIDVLA